MQTPTEMKRAARRAPDGSPSKFDGIWNRIRAEFNREEAAEQIKSAPIEHPLPMRRLLLECDRLARLRLGLPLVDHDANRRRDFGKAVTADQFGEAKRRGRKRGRR